MKRINKSIKIISLMATVILLCWFSCDKISEPYMTTNTGNNIDTTKKVRKVLLEDFTGHLCVYCPQGHKIAKDLEEVYGNRLVVVSIHAGFQAFPVSSPYDYDFRTPEGTDMNSTFGISTYPSGLVNRKKVGGSLVLDRNEWGSAVADIINTPPDAYISINNTYNSITRSLNVNIETEILSNLTGTYRLCVYLIEDNIIKPQKNNDAAIGPGDIWDYNHMHVLRASINSTWGDTLAVNPVVGQKIVKSFTGFSLNAEWKDDDCTVIAFIYRDDDDDNNRYEVVQAEKKKLK